MSFSEEAEGKDCPSPERPNDHANRPPENGTRRRKIKPKWDEQAAPDDIWPIYAPDTD